MAGAVLLALAAPGLSHAWKSDYGISYKDVATERVKLANEFYARCVIHHVESENLKNRPQEGAADEASSNGQLASAKGDAKDGGDKGEPQASGNGVANPGGEVDEGFFRTLWNGLGEGFAFISSGFSQNGKSKESREVAEDGIREAEGGFFEGSGEPASQEEDGASPANGKSTQAAANSQSGNPGASQDGEIHLAKAAINDSNGANGESLSAKYAKRGGNLGDDGHPHGGKADSQKRERKGGKKGKAESESQAQGTIDGSIMDGEIKVDYDKGVFANSRISELVAQATPKIKNICKSETLIFQKMMFDNETIIFLMQARKIDKRAGDLVLAYGYNRIGMTRYLGIKPPVKLSGRAMRDAMAEYRERFEHECQHLMHGSFFQDWMGKDYCSCVAEIRLGPMKNASTMGLLMDLRKISPDAETAFLTAVQKSIEPALPKCTRRAAF